MPSDPTPEPGNEAGDGDHRPYTREESEAHRLDRNLAELLQELRVIGAGVQILFAFLLAIAFQARFTTLGSLEKAVYIVTLLLAALATGLLVAPVAIHRLAFREGRKDEVVRASNLLAMGGLGSLALSMTGAVLLVVREVDGWAAAVPCAVGLALVLGLLWLALPLSVRRGGSSRRG
jgi:hypothetical protein